MKRKHKNKQTKKHILDFEMNNGDTPESEQY